MHHWVGAVLALLSQSPGSESWIGSRQDDGSVCTVATSHAGAALAAKPLPSGEHAYRAANREQGLAITFTESSVDVACDGDEPGSWTWGMKLVAYGRGERAAPVSDGTLALNGPRVEYRRPNLLEWYVNEPRGLKQNFTLLRPPFAEQETSSSAPIFLELELRGDLRVERTEGGLLFHDPHDDRCLAYSELVAWDATGTLLATRMEWTGNRVRLVVHDDRAAWPLTVDPLIAKEQTKLTAADAVEQDYFAYSVSLSGDTALVGMPLDDDLGEQSGSARVFVRDGTTWTPQAKLTADGGGQFDNFGIAVALWEDTALIGSSEEMAHVFVRTGTEWSEQARLTIGPSNQFGRSVALSGDTALVGSDIEVAGAAHVFERSGTVWTEQATLVAPDGGPTSRFGASLALFDDSALIGAPNANGGGQSSGAAYLFTRVGSAWVHEAKLGSGDGAVADQFGLSVSLARGVALVGAPFDDDTVPNSGSAYVFRRAGTAWVEAAKLTASDVRLDDRFGSAVALAKGMAVVGAERGGGHDIDTGAAHLFERRGTTWDEVLVLRAGDAENDPDRFGANLSLSGGSVLIAAHGDDDLRGAAYVFVLTTAEPYCTAKANSLGCLPRIDFTGFPSATDSSGFALLGTNFRNQSPGLALYGLAGPAAEPFQGGLLCVRPPISRTPARSSRGHLPPIRDCSGHYRLDLNAFAAGIGGGDPRPELRIPGMEVHCQWWARDGDDPFGSSLSDGLAYTVGP